MKVFLRLEETEFLLDLVKDCDITEENQHLVPGLIKRFKQAVLVAKKEEEGFIPKEEDIVCGIVGMLGRC